MLPNTKYLMIFGKNLRTFLTGMLHLSFLFSPSWALKHVCICVNVIYVLVVLCDFVYEITKGEGVKLKHYVSLHKGRGKKMTKIAVI